MKQYFGDSYVVFLRSMTLSLQNPIWILVSIMQPILYLGLFGPLLVQIVDVPGFPAGDAWQVFVPGILVQLAMFGSLFVGFGIVAEWRSGVIDRMLVTPVSKNALITGRVLRDVIMLIVQSIILIGVAFLFGLRVGPGAIFASLVLVGMLGAAFSYFSYAAGLWLKSEDVLAPMINSIALPLMLLSGILLPMSLAPRWLQIFSDFNPIKHVVQALRSVFRGEYLNFETILGLFLALGVLGVAAIVGNLAIKSQAR